MSGHPEKNVLEIFLINFHFSGLRVAVPPNIMPAGCPINDQLARGRGSNIAPQRGLMRRPPVPSRGGQLEIAGVVVGQWGANYGQPGRLPQPLQGHPRGRLPPQVRYRYCMRNRSITMVHRRIYVEPGIPAAAGFSDDFGEREFI